MLQRTVEALEDRSIGPQKVLHVMNGDVAARLLERSVVVGAVTVWADVLHDGPVRPDLSSARLRELRARFVSRSGFISYEDALGRAERWDEWLESFADYDEVVLWFEHDLFDQLLLIRQLDWFGRRDLGGSKLSLICIGEFDGVPDFIGLGQLTPEQLASQFETRSSPRLWTSRHSSSTLGRPAFCSGERSYDPGPGVILRRGG